MATYTLSIPGDYCEVSTGNISLTYVEVEPYDQDLAEQIPILPKTGDQARLDTHQKRGQMLALTRTFSLLPFPDGTTGRQDRVQFAGFYGAFRTFRPIVIMGYSEREVDPEEIAKALGTYPRDYELDILNANVEVESSEIEVFTIPWKFPLLIQGVDVLAETADMGLIYSEE